MEYVVYGRDGQKIPMTKWERFCDGSRKVTRWMRENPELTCAIVATGVVVIPTTTAIKNHGAMKIETMKLHRIYDPSLGAYWSLRKPLTNGQMVTIQNARAAGETLGNILMKMNMLK